jgi:hypothetical protein
MKFWVLGYLYQEDVYYDFEMKEDSYDLKPSCFLPTKEMAQQIIGQELSVQYIPIEIELQTLNFGSWSWSRDKLPFWDDEGKEDVDN